MSELIPKKATDYQGTISQRLERITKELGKIEHEIKVQQELREKHRAKKVDFEAKALNEVDKIRKRMGEIIASKSYQEHIQWEGQTTGFGATGLNEKLTETLIGTVNVYMIYIVGVFRT